MAYDLLGQNIEGNYSTVRLYGILHVTNNYVSWSRGSASVHTSGLQGIGTYYSKGDYVVVQADFTWGHAADGSFSLWVGASLSTTFVSGDTGGTITLPTIPRQANVTSANNFNDEQNPTITFSNPGGFRINARLEFGGTNIQRDNIPNTGSYTFNLTDAERKLLRQKCTGNSMAVRQVIGTCIGGTTENHWSWLDRTMTIVNGNPTFYNFEFEDTNNKTLTLTGNSQYNINGYSNIKAIISTANKAEALKEATMSKYRFSIGSSSLDISYSDDENVSGILNNSVNGTYSVYAIDSRNNSTLVTKLSTKEINYEQVYINKQNCNFIRNNNQVGKNAILTLNGTFWNDNFGAITNTIKSVNYRFKKTNSNEWVNGTTPISLVINEKNFSFTGEIASDNEDTTWDLESSYNLEVTISDELSTATIDLILNSGIPTMSLDKNGIGIMCAYDEELGGFLQIDGMRYSQIYREEETVIGRWKDGRNIYRKIVTDSGGFDNESNISHGISRLDRVLDYTLSCIDKQSSVNTQYVNSRLTSDGAYVGVAGFNNSYIRIFVNSAFGSNRLVDYIITLIYLKTSDKDPEETNE